PGRPEIAGKRGIPGSEPSRCPQRTVVTVPAGHVIVHFGAQPTLTRNTVGSDPSPRPEQTVDPVPAGHVIAPLGAQPTVTRDTLGSDPSPRLHGTVHPSRRDTSSRLLAHSR